MENRTAQSRRPGIGHNRASAPFFKEALPIGPAVIFRRARSAMTSGKRGTKRWVLRFERRRPLHIEPLMGWTADDDPMAHLELKFDSLSSAIGFAEREGIKYRLHTSHAAKPVERKRPHPDRRTE